MEERRRVAALNLSGGVVKNDEFGGESSGFITNVFKSPSKASSVATGVATSVSSGVVASVAASVASTALTNSPPSDTTTNPNFAFGPVPTGLTALSRTANQPITTSTKCPLPLSPNASAKLIKLKGELFNLLYIFPEKALEWGTLNEEDERTVDQAGEAAAKQAETLHTPHLNSDPPLLTQEEFNKLVEKARRKAKRRLKRALARDRFVQAVQTAVTPNDLMRMIVTLQRSIPAALTHRHDYDRLNSFETALTVSDCALRLFILDRSIAYDAIQGLETASQHAPWRLRCQFAPRCHANGVCIRYMGHGNKCVPGSTNFSRLPDMHQLAPLGDSFCTQTKLGLTHHHHPSGGSGGGAGSSAAAGAGNAAGSHALHNNYNNSSSYNGRPTSGYVRPVTSYSRPEPVVQLRPLALILERPNPDIEAVQGYVPTALEITNTVWI